MGNEMWDFLQLEYVMPPNNRGKLSLALEADGWKLGTTGRNHLKNKFFRCYI